MKDTRMTGAIRRSLEARLGDLDARTAALDAQGTGDDSVEATALLMQLARERSDIVEALRDAILIDDEPFDTQAIEIGDTVAIRDSEGETERYVLVGGNIGSRARSDWVSVHSPLGAALLGRSKGDRVRVELPMGATTYVVLDFERASEDSFVREGAGEQGGNRSTLISSETFLG